MCCARTAALQVWEGKARVNTNMGCLQQLMHHVDPATVRKKHDKLPPKASKTGPGPSQNLLLKIEAQGLQESQDAPKRRPRPARRRPRAPKGQPRSAQEVRKGAPEPPKSGQDAPKRRPGGSQNRSKTSLASPRTNFLHDVGGKLCVKGSWNDF